MLIKDHDSILEIGFGSGNNFPDLLAKANDINVSSIDYSPGMRELAKNINKIDVDTVHSSQLPLDEDGDQV
ncbi:MAG: class I SAM-dependent methyltransferase [Balneolaceae bacterium]|nr:MAG: class I SAM-dependent methyltransferase [Balneolaceae bacterium]